MKADHQLTRRGFIKTAALGAAAAGSAGSLAATAKADAAASRRIPLKLGIRAANMQMVGDFDVN